MRTLLPSVVLLGLTIQPVSAEMPVLFDNLYLSTGAGLERLRGEDKAGYGFFGANWGIPLSPPSDVALGLQLGGDMKLRDDNGREWNATVGGFGRRFPTFGQQHGALAMLFDYRRTVFDDDVWALRPVLGTTISPRDALGVEGLTTLQAGRRTANESLRTFWTRGWSDHLGTEFGAGYELKRVKGAQFRARAAIRLTAATDLWCGGDANLRGNYAVGIGVSYRLGGTGRHAILNNIDGAGRDAYTPFPTADFPSMLTRKK